MKYCMGLFIAMALVVFIAGSAIAGGQGEAEEGERAVEVYKTGYPISSEPVTLKVTAPYGAMYKQPVTEYPLVVELLETTGVNVEWELIETSTWQNTKAIILASRDLPDIFLRGLSEREIMDGVFNGNIIGLDALVDEYAPNIQRIFEMRPNMRSIWSARDGNLYATGSVNEMFGMGLTHGTLSINKTWLDNFGLEVPTTIEEYEYVLEVLVNGDPNGNGIADEVGLSFIDGPAGTWRNHGAPGAMFGAFGRPDTGDHVVVENGRVLVSAVEPEYKDAIMWFRRLYEKGLIDPDSFSHTEAEMTAKGSAKDAIYVSFIDWDTSHTVGTDRAQDDYILLKPLVGPAEEKIWSRENNVEWGRNVSVITSVSKNPEDAMRFIDYGYDPFISARWVWGDYGIQFKEQEGMLMFKDLEPGATIWQRNVDSAPPSWFPNSYLNEYFENVVQYPPDAQSMFEARRDYYAPYISDEFYPPMTMTADDLTEMSVLTVSINSIIDEKRAVWITEGGIEHEWDQYLADLKSVGLDRYIEIKQKYYDEYLARIGE